MMSSSMPDIMADLGLLQFECGLTEDEKLLMYLRGQAMALTVSACAHAAFFCRLLNAVRQKVSTGSASLITKVSRLWTPASGYGLKVGIIGGGHIGKQLATVLMEVTDLTAANIQISSRRPETLYEFQKLGIECFYNNCRLSASSDVLFLCCLPSHLSKICAEIQDNLSKSCIVYSLVTSTSLARLKQLLAHSAILRPEYQFTEGDAGLPWGKGRTVTAALKDPAVIEATWAYRPAGGISVSAKWFAAALYSALNLCTEMKLPHQQSMQLLNELLLLEPFTAKEGGTTPPEFVRENFVNKAFAATLSEEDFFPCFDLSAVQTKDTPLSQLLAGSPSLQERLARTYCTSFGVLPTENRVALSS